MKIPDTFLNTLSEGHAAAIGAFGGFVTGFTGDKQVAKMFAVMVYRHDCHAHQSDAHKELAYTSGFYLAFFTIGYAIGSYVGRGEGSPPLPSSDDE